MRVHQETSIALASVPASLSGFPTSNGLPTLSIVIPAYNEELRLPRTLDRIFEYLTATGWTAEVIVVNDGSTDATPDIVRQCIRRKRDVRLVENCRNCGKGYSVRNGVMQASGDWVLITDADLSTPIEEVEKMFAAAHENKSQIALGSRALDRSLVTVRQSGWREASGRIFNIVMSALTALPYRDTQCGFKLYSRGAARQIFVRQQLDGFGFDVEDLYIARLLGIPAVELPVRWKNAEGSKVSTLAGLKAFYELICIRWNSVMGRYR